MYWGLATSLTARSVRASKSSKIFQRTQLHLATLLLTFFAVFAQAAHAQSVDWLLNIDESADPVPAGATIDYEIEVTNNGPDTAPATQVRFTVPPDTSLGGTIDGAGLAITGCAPVPATAGVEVVCDVPSLAIDEAASFVAQILTTTAGVIDLEASVDDPGGIDTSGTNNSLTETTTVQSGADLGITLALPAGAPPNTAPAGSRVPITLTVENFGPDTADSYVVEFPAPSGLADFTVPPQCSLSGGLFTCNITDDLAVGGTLQLDFTAQIVTESGSDITGTASVGTTIPGDGVAANNTSTATLIVTPGVDLAVDISRDTPANVLTGDEVEFTISPSYTGDNPTDIVVTHTVPPNFQIDNISAPGWTVSQVGSDLTFTRASGSGPGDDVSLGDIVIETTAVSAGAAISEVTIDTTGPLIDQQPGNNSDSITTTITDPVVDLAAIKTGPSPALGVVGNPYSFQIRTRNVGNAEFFGTIEMTDSIPAGLRVDSLGTGPWTCVPSVPLPAAGPFDIDCSLVYTAGSPLGAGAQTPAVTVNSTPLSDGLLSNTLTVGSPDANIADTNAPNDTTTFGLGVSTGPNSADISVVKSVVNPTLAAGDVQTYRLEIVNDGPTSSFDVELSDNFTALINNNTGNDQGYEGQTLIPGPHAGGLTCSTASSGGRSRLLTCDIAQLDVCTAGVDCPVIEVQVRHGTDRTNITNTADVISTSTPDPDLTNNDDSTSFTQTREVDITVDKTVSDTSVPAGQNVTYVVAARVVPTGQSHARDLTVIDTLPDGVRFISASPAQGSCSTVPTPGDIIQVGVNDEVICNLGTVNNGQQRTVTIVVQPTNAQLGDTLLNTADVTTSTPEDDVEPNSDTASTLVEVPDTDLIVNKDDTPDPIVVGENTVYTVTVTNAGPSSSEDIVVTDILPPGLISFQSFTIDAPGTCGTPTNPVPAPGTFGGTLVCEYPFLAAGDSFEIQVTALGEAKGDVANVVSISSFEIDNGYDRLAGNNQTEENTTVRTRTDIGLPSKTPSLGTVFVEQNFTFDVTVAVGTGPGLAEADDVVVSDTLPAGMLLTGNPTTAFPGGVCTGAAGDTSFTCDLGTINAGDTVTIQVPVEVIAVTSEPQTFTNTATVTTSSLDVTPDDNSASGSVDVLSSSLAGTVFRDFADDAIQNGTDTGVAGVTMTLTGTSDDGRPVSQSVVTDANGDYLFSNLPAGTYTVTRGAPGEPLLADGTNTPGSEGGAVSGADALTSITLGDDVDATNYDFALIPQATVGLAKTLSAQSVNADGSFNATFSLVVENLSLERLINLSVTDTLAGGSPLFGTLATPGDPANDPLADGSYAILAAPGGTCGGFEAGFNGAASNVLASGFALDVGSTCTVTFQIRVQPTDPLPPTLASGGEYENSADVTGTGEASGQPVSDTSDDGTTPDTDGDRVADEPGENDPTPVPVSLTPSIALVKTADTSALSTPPVAGEIITYSFAVTNTGNVTLTNVTLTDPLPGINVTGGPIPSLSPGASDATTFTATYAITQADIDVGQVVNQATTTGTPPAGPDVGDDSGTTTGDDVPTTTPLTSGPGITLVKTADTSALQSPPQVGDTITYRFAITNTGNVTLSNVTIADALPGVVLTGNPIVALAPGQTDTTTITGTYVLVPDDLTAGEVVNTATVTGNPPTGPPLTDDDTTTTPLPQVPGIDLVKAITDSSDLDDGAQVGDTITYDFTVTNTGNVPLRDVTIVDALPGVILSGGPIALMNPAAVGDSTDVDSTTYTASYTLTAADVANSGIITNVATATGTYGPAGAPLTVDDDSSVTAQPPDPSDGLTLIKTVSPEVIRRGVPVSYVIRLINDNPFAAGPLDLIDTLPLGLVYVDGSAQVDGVDWPVTVDGQVVTFPDVVAAANTEVVATLNARLLTGANPGLYTNTVLALDPPFGVVAGPATATVRLLPEAVFDCADIVGRVFNDVDGDGYQDPYDPDARPDEDDKQPVTAPRNETGIAGVRLVALDGMIITTDANGLFSVPCASLPRDSGSNFLLSLDERTLPTGFSMTTPNPLVMRLTPGMLSEMNFGARLARTMRIDLNAAAFSHGPGINPTLTQGISAMVERLAGDPMGVDLVYHVPANADLETVAEARAAMDAVATEIHRQWEEARDGPSINLGLGLSRLSIRQTIARGE
ncbi:MAG: conserved repeat domain [Rhodobacteraceae bacterium HLUCCO18]|nr:MAG: conserved repeat domain [Rhodobacteraceae bacterium HLUCCO18]